MQRHIDIIECPRDAMQGWHRHILTKEKKVYLNALLKVGFHTLDCGSFVSAKAIPQMADTAEVLEAIAPQIHNNKLLVIVANERGALAAAEQPSVTYIGFPFSISPTFQQLNTNSSIEESWLKLQRIHAICQAAHKQMVVYISMAFGNPYGDEYNAALVYEWVNKLEEEGIKIISLADTVGLSQPDQVYQLTHSVMSNIKNAHIGVHLHSALDLTVAKIDAAYQAGCRRFDTAIGGIGGCPMAKNDLVGNIDTSILINYCNNNNIELNINLDAYQKAVHVAQQIFF